MDAIPVNEDDYFQLSAIQHMAFCPRQCCLIHLEQQWSGNYFTTLGDLMHERVDSSEITRTPDGVRQVRSLPLFSRKYGLSGQADLVEFDDRRGIVRPVEYKVGKPKQDETDAVQLCAQAFCLEEMLHVTIADGAIYYGKTRRRVDFAFDDALRSLTEEKIRAVHELLRSGKTPPPLRHDPRCAACSLHELCCPELFDGADPAEYMERCLNEED